MRVLSRAVLFLSLIPAAANAQQLLTLEEAIAATLKNNYDILLAKNDSSAAAIDYSYRNAALFPRLNGNLGTTWFNNNTKQILSDGTKRESKGLRSNNVLAQLALNWTLFDGLKMFATRDKLAEFVKLGELAVKNQVISSVAHVITTYYSIVRQKQQLRAIEEQMGLNQERVKLAQYKLDIGAGTKPDVLQAQVDLNAQKAAQLQQQTLIGQLKEELNQLMRIPPGGADYDVPDSIPLNRHLVLVDIQSTADRENPTLLIAQKNIDIAGLALKERRAERFPTVSLNAAYNFNRNRNRAVINTFSTLFNRNYGFNYGFTATIPIFNNFNTRRLIQQAELDVQYFRLSYENQRSLVSLAVIRAYRNYEQLLKALELEESNIVLAKENVDIIFQIYRLGATTYIQLREAQKSLEDAYTRLINARYNTKLAETELLRLKGELVH
ncbi:MAG TPA: TolC family protein [Chitinophagaceae bacterium]|nr:TolC family protein [Chitinophagaceae bacterium]